MTVCVFTGPTIPAAAVSEHLDALCMPPARQGDIYRAAMRLKLDAMGIIDGYFHQVPSIWHKEILWAMSKGIRVFGAASMGALRAAELCDFGMCGVGRIFDAYRDGVFPGYEQEAFEDDDEVAVVHGPAASGYVALSEAMVNIRATLSVAWANGIVTEATRGTLIAAAKSCFYPKRTWEALLRAGREADLARAELDRLEVWLPRGRIDQKREDAVAMLDAMRDRDPRAFEVGYQFEHTRMWDRLAMQD